MSPLARVPWAIIVTAPAVAVTVPNGNFEAGNTGFTSQYVYAPAQNTTEGQYTVRNAPHSWNPGFTDIFDHTTDSASGLMLVVNGSTAGQDNVWRVSVPVQANTAYEFNSFVSSADAGGPADLIVLANDAQLGQDFVAPETAGSWVPFTRQWFSGNATAADLRIVDTSLARFPNDFYLDDITLNDLAPGDANRDGHVTADDYALIDRGFERHLTGWSNGDFNLDGTINAADYLIIDRSLASQGGFSSEVLSERESQFGPDYVSAVLSAVPEPDLVTFSVLSLLSSLLITYRCPAQSRRAKRVSGTEAFGYRV